jgi:SAM-dependent methyltransferase
VEPESAFPLLAPPAPCPGCGGASRRPLHVFALNHRKPRATRQAKLAVLGCEACGTSAVHPLPSDGELADYYAGAAGRDVRAAERPEAVAPRLERLHASHARNLELVTRHVQLPLGEERAALDFGCGIGGWLDALAAAGWRTSGIEPGRRAAAVASRRHRLLERIPDRPTFDLVVVHHTLEHLRDPGDVLRRLATALSPGGAIWISVPNAERLGEHRDIDYMWSDKHLCAFTTAALESLLARAGIEVAAASRDGWELPLSPKRLVVVGRKAGAGPPQPERPLEPLLAALRAYGATLRDPVEAVAQQHGRRSRIAGVVRRLRPRRFSQGRS